VSISFVYIFIASLFQLGWLYSTQRIDKKKIVLAFKRRQIRFWVKGLLPPLGYLSFGIANVVALTHAMQQLAPSMVYAMWTGLVIFFSALLDAGAGRMKLSWKRILFLTMVMGGTVGLNLLSRES